MIFFVALCFVAWRDFWERKFELICFLMNKPNKFFKNSVRILVPDGFIISRKEIFVGLLNKIGELTKKLILLANISRIIFG